ncbi:hypothetical protein HU200_065166 [Digitaria exilis]|uniref:Uncharacterized protein n=1 Tax=Digitaria exilis TaxID=1010633 RepID=A0A835A2A1_9POAL|nr:hypothetical protein HU200_065166 [Digitaria exilis]
MWQSARLQPTVSDELGQSCRVYCPATGKVPFEWEDEPGKPKGSARMDVVPPLCPSPAMQRAAHRPARPEAKEEQAERRDGGWIRRLHPAAVPLRPGDEEVGLSESRGAPSGSIRCVHM